MKIPEEHRQKLQELFEQSGCTKSPNCLEKSPEDICPVKDMPGVDLIECTEHTGCRFALLFGYSTFCKCPVRMYLKKNCGI